MVERAPEGREDRLMEVLEAAFALALAESGGPCPKCGGYRGELHRLGLRCPQGVERAAAEQVDLPRPWCRDCGPGYRIGDEGCRHDEHGFYGPPEQPVIGEEAICRTCALPIVYELGELGHRNVVGWSDRIKRGGDSVVCFKAVGYRHVPMGAREEAIYRAGVKAGQTGD